METGQVSSPSRLRAINLASTEIAGRTAGERVPTREAARLATKSDPALATFFQRLASEIGPSQVERYFGGQTRVTLKGDTLEVAVGSGYLGQLLERRFGDMVRRIAGEQRLCAPDKVKFVVDRAAAPAELAPAPAAPKPAARAAAPVSSTRYRFENFIVGRSNRLAYSAATRAAEEDGAFAPLFIHGTCGLGKTHLLRAAATRFLERRPGSVVRITTAEAFTNEFVQAVRGGSVEPFRRSYRRVDLLCVDDVHFFASKEATQSELLHTLDAVAMDGARILLASDEHPKEIAKLSERLVSRFMSGAVVKIDPPEPELRLRLVKHIASLRQIALDDDACLLLAERSAQSPGALGGFGGSVREIEGLLNQVEAVHRLLPEFAGAGGVVNASLVTRALGLDAPARPMAPGGRLRRPVTADTVVTEICRELSVDMGDFMGKGRHKRVVLARSLVASLSRRLTTMSFPEIARAMGRSNHSTVITAQRRIDRQIADDTGRPLSAEVAGPHAGRGLRELSELLVGKIQRAASGL